MTTPIFLQRCLRHKIQEKLKKKIQMTVCLMKRNTDWKNVFPVYICLARRISNGEVPRDRDVYQIGRIFIFRNSAEVDLNSVQVKFTLPEVNKLAKEARSGTLYLLFVSAATVEGSNLSHGVNSNLPTLDLNDAESGEYCLLGKISLESLYMSWNYFPNFRLGQRAEVCSTVDMLPCILKSNFQNQDTKVSVHYASNSNNMSVPKELHVQVSAEEFGSKEKSSRPMRRM